MIDDQTKENRVTSTNLDNKNNELSLLEDLENISKITEIEFKDIESKSPRIGDFEAKQKISFDKKQSNRLSQ